MAFGITGAYSDADSPSQGVVRRATIDKYSALGDYIDEINKPDNRELLVKTFGDQGITGFLKLTGAVKAAGTNDQVQWWEETRLHPIQSYTVAGSAITAAKSQTVTLGSNDTYVRVGDIVLLAGGERAYVSAVTAGTSFVIKNLLDANLPQIAIGSGKIAIVGNLYAQGTDQPGEFFESNVTKRTNGYSIIKEIYKVTGSQATNIGWINLGAGDYRWYIKSEQDTRQRFMDKREMMMLLGVSYCNCYSCISGICWF